MAIESEILVRVVGQRNVNGRREPTSDHVVTTMHSLPFEPLRDVHAYVKHERFERGVVANDAGVAGVEPDTSVEPVSALAVGWFGVDVAGVEVHSIEATA